MRRHGTWSRITGIMLARWYDLESMHAVCLGRIDPRCTVESARALGHGTSERPDGAR